MLAQNAVTVQYTLGVFDIKQECTHIREPWRDMVVFKESKNKSFYEIYNSYSRISIFPLDLHNSFPRIRNSLHPSVRVAISSLIYTIRSLELQFVPSINTTCSLELQFIFIPSLHIA